MYHPKWEIYICHSHSIDLLCLFWGRVSLLSPGYHFPLSQVLCTWSNLILELEAVGHLATTMAELKDNQLVQLPPCLSSGQQLAVLKPIRETWEVLQLPQGIIPSWTSSVSITAYRDGQYPQLNWRAQQPESNSFSLLLLDQGSQISCLCSQKRSQQPGAKQLQSLYRVS